MYTTILILLVIVCIMLILIVLVQNSKGGGLASSFAASNKIMGVRKTTDFPENATWTLAGALFFLCIISSMLVPRGEQGSGSVLDGQLQNTPPAQTAPVFPLQVPDGESALLPLEEKGE